MSHIVKTENFLSFFSSATKLVEVAITEETALGLDRYSDDLVTEDANELVSVQRVFHDEKWSRGRPVTSLDWCFLPSFLSKKPKSRRSPKFPELVMGSYSSRETTTNEAEVKTWEYRKPTRYINLPFNSGCVSCLELKVQERDTRVCLHQRVPSCDCKVPAGDF